MYRIKIEKRIIIKENENNNKNRKKMEKKKTLVLYQVDLTESTELELSFHETNYEYCLLSLENHNKKIYFEFEDKQQIYNLIDGLKDLVKNLYGKKD